MHPYYTNASRKPQLIARGLASQMSCWMRHHYAILISRTCRLELTQARPLRNFPQECFPVASITTHRACDLQSNDVY